MDTIYKIAAIGIAITSAIALISAKLITAAEYSVVEVGTERIDGFSAQSIKNATIGDEGEAYSGEMWLSKDGNVTHPEWFEGDKLINADGTYYLIKAEAAPDYYENGSAEFDPYVIIGDGSDEAENKVEYANGSDVSVNTVDGRDYTYRTLGNNGSMVINLKCSPNETNYLTVQLWGGDTGEGMLWVCDPVSGFMNPTDSEQPHRNGIVDRRNWVELNTLSSTPQYDGGFIYTTYEIPEIYTEGRESVSLRIYSTGGPADYGAIVIKEQTSQSRGIYGAFMEQDPYFEPEEYGITGGGYTNDAQISEVSYDDTKEQLKEAVRSGIDTLREWQIYGGDNYPPYMSGMITRSGSWQAKAAEDEDVTSYAWCDETARSVVIKDNGERIYMTLNWRNPMYSQNYYNTPYQTDNQRIQINNLARVHATNGKYDRYGYAGISTDAYSEPEWTEINKNGENSCIQALMICRYGDYTVIMNSRGCQGGTARNYGWNEFEAEAELDRACEYTNLVTGKVYTYSGGQWACGAEVMRLGSNSTMVLKKSGLRTYVGYNGAGEAEVTIKNVTSSAEEITVYSADRGNDGSLEGIRAEGLTAEPGISTINIKADSGSEIFVWNANMTPILDKIITIDIDK